MDDKGGLCRQPLGRFVGLVVFHAQTIRGHPNGSLKETLVFL
jgi:hypothetical protein